MKNESRLTFPVIIFFIFLISLQFFYHTPVSVLNSSIHNAQLDGDWEVCFISDVVRPDLGLCKWTKISVPKSVPHQYLPTEKGWILYRKIIKTPDFCHNDYIHCSLILGEVGDSFEVSLNNQVIGKHGGLPPFDSYAKHIPAKVNIPKYLLKIDGDNQLQLSVRYLKRSQSGIIRGPVAITPAEDANKIARQLMLQNLFIPIFSAFGILLLIMLTFSWLYFNKVADRELLSVSRYGLVSSLFLISYSGFPREFIDINFAGAIHFILRFAMDWSVYEFAFLITGYLPRLRNIIRFSYCTVIALFVLMYSLYVFVPSHLRFLTGFTGAVTLSGYVDFFLVFGPYFYSFLAFNYSKKYKNFRLSILFLILSIIVFLGVLTFHGAKSFPHFVIFYPFFLVVILLIEFWSRYFFNYQSLIADSKIAQVVTQVAHDIRSPLAAVEMIKNDLVFNDPNKQKLLNLSIDRIKAIANDLLEYQDKKTSSQVAFTLIESIIEEKLVQYRPFEGLIFKFNPEMKFRNLHIAVNSIEFKRIISNLINNAIESMNHSGLVSVELNLLSNRQLQIMISDQGKGIPSNMLSKLGTRGVSFNKVGGSGLGIFHARTTIESWGGSLRIESQVGVGTQVSLLLPVVKDFLSQ